MWVYQLSTKRSTSGGEARDQGTAVQRIFHLKRSSFFCISTLLLVRTQCSLHFAPSWTEHQPDSCPPQLKSHSMHENHLWQRSVVNLSRILLKIELITMSLVLKPCTYALDDILILVPALPPFVLFVEFKCGAVWLTFNGFKQLGAHVLFAGLL